MVSDKGSNSTRLGKPSRGLFSRFFKERELLLRTNGEVQFLRLSSNLQAGFSACAVVFILWSASASVSSWLQYIDLNKKSEEIIEAKLSYNNLRREIDQFETRMVGLNKRMLGLVDGEETTSLEALKDEMKLFSGLGSELRLTVKRLNIDLNIPESEKHRIIASRESLHDQIGELEDHLHGANKRVENTQVDIANLNRELSAINRNRERISKERDKLLMSVAMLEGHIEKAQSDNVALMNNNSVLNEDISSKNSSIEELESNDIELRQQLVRVTMNLDDLNTKHTNNLRRIGLAAKRLANTTGNKDEYLTNSPKYVMQTTALNRLERQVKRVVGDLADARSNEKNITHSIDRVLTGLSRVAGVDRLQENTNRKNADQVLSQLEQIEGLHDTQLDMVVRLNAQAAANINQTEKLIRTTGIDPDRMLELSGLPTGQGGPLIETDFVNGSSAKLETKVAALESKVSRWEALSKITQCIPMISPVDYYNLTSKFGKRKDPFTGKKAVHKGVDMGGWPGTNVWSTAAGKVTFAGNSGRYGKMVEIDHGCGIKTIYGHLKKVLVKKGQQVSHRYKIGKLGSTGRSTGPHVHFEIRVEGEAVDPMKFIEAGRNVFKG